MAKLYKEIKNIILDDYNHDTNMCGVIATSIVTERCYDDIYRDYKKLGRKDRKGVKWDQMRDMLKRKGYSTRLTHSRRQHWNDPLDYDEAPVLLAPKNCTGFTMKTIGRILDRNKVYLVNCRGHIAAYKGGELQDWSVDTKRHVQLVWEVNPVELKKVTLTVKKL